MTKTNHQVDFIGLANEINALKQDLFLKDLTNARI